MKILAIEREINGVGENQFQPFLKNEAQRVWELYQDDIIREIYFRDNRSEAILIFECQNVNEATKILSTLPLVKEGLIEFELIPLKPYPGFSRLFTSE
jgi:muconolactone delta-isomerase